AHGVVRGTWECRRGGPRDRGARAGPRDRAESLASAGPAPHPGVGAVVRTRGSGPGGRGAGSHPVRRGSVPPRARRRGQLMPPPFRKHVFICLNERPPDSEKGDCTRKGSPQLLKKFKAALRDRGLDEEIRANKAGCLDNCENGCSVVVYPEGVWYGHV